MEISIYIMRGGNSRINNKSRANNVLHTTECTHLLLAHGAPVKVKNLEGWSPLAEAISYGDRQTSKSLIVCVWAASQ